jgi:cytochrome P450
LNNQNISAFTYVRQVIEESLRVYPTIWSVGRRCTETDTLDGYEIPRGMNVVVPIFHIHWSRRYWDEPEKFNPSRFAPERRPPGDGMTYFPFGAGPRSCVGNHFALQELMILTVTFYRHYRFRVAPGFKVEPDPLITLRPKHGMKMVLQARASETDRRASGVDPAVHHIVP